ncbi:MAG: oligosaccharide flippase family protein [Bacteroides sp.]|nr:oligosaccharide flippase family protein [Bacteroides sp.]
MGKLLKKYNNLSAMSRASLWLAFCNLMMKGISVITVPIFTRLLTTEEYGTYSLYLSWFNILTIFTSLYLYYGVFNNVLNRVTKPDERDKYVSSMQGLTTFLVIILSLIYLSCRSFWSDLLRLSEAALCLMLLHLWVEPCAQFWLARQRFEFKYKHAVAITTIKSLLNPLLGLLLVLNTSRDKALARILSVVMTELLVAGSLMIYQFFKGRTFFDKSNWKYALRFNIPLLPHYLSMVVLSQADRVMIERYAGVGKVGIYSVAYSIGMLAQVFTNAVNSSLTPWTYEKLNRKDYKAIRENTNTLLLLLAGVICCMLLFVPEVVAFFAPEKYYEAIYVVPPVACSVFFTFLYNIFAIPQMYFERQKFMSAASTAAAALNIILNYIFIRMFGYIAAGYTTVACYLIYSIGHYVFNQMVCKDKTDGHELYDQKSILLISTFVLLCSVGFNFLYSFSVIRYVLFVIVGIVAFIFRRKITGVMLSVRKKS